MMFTSLTSRAALKKDFSDKKRKTLAKDGKAMPDGSYPIESVQDLKNAVQSYGRAADPEAVKKHIKARAKALNATSELPDDWKATKAGPGAVLKGDSPGHEFRGNQYTAGKASGSDKPNTKAIGSYLSGVGKSYHDKIPLTDIINHLDAHGYHAVQEDGSSWSGMLTGKDGRAVIDLRNKATGQVDNGLAIQWHKMDSGRWETNAYLTGAAQKADFGKILKG